MKGEYINVQPLYKVLNEQRTQGVWEAIQGDSMNRYQIVTPDMTISDVLAIDIPDEEGEANAQYTALAVNNLAPLAKVLEECLSEFETHHDSDDKDSTTYHLISKVKQALSKIS